jgi:ABC-type sugar transport system permease subunit
MTSQTLPRADPDKGQPRKIPRAKGARLSDNGPRLRFQATPYILILPVGAFLAVFTLLPFLWAVLISVQPPLAASSGQISTFSIANFREIFTDPNTVNSLLVTLIYAALTTILIIVVSIVTALALKTVRRGSGLYQLVLIIPLTLAPPVVVILWQALFDPTSGAVDGVLVALHLPQQGFYESTSQALLVIVAMAVWSNSGFWTLVFLSNLRTFSTEVFEAASVDGSGPIRTFFSITFPLLRRTVLLASVVLSTAGLVVFIPAQLLTQGGPGNATDFMMFEAAQDVLRFGTPGNANAIVVVLLVLIGIVAAIQFRLIRSEDA